MPQPSVEPHAEPSLVGPAVVGAASSAFARLNQAVQDSVPPPIAPDPGPAMSGNGKTVEDLVKEMLRPMLKEWLDRNLPPMVERYVEREIVRLTRR
jgi:cell pole-organizing protein PopZ